MADETPQRQQASPQADWRPIPDPTTLTTAALIQAVGAERDFVVGQIKVLDERLRGMDRATELLNETVHRVPTEMQEAIRHLEGLVDERFKSVALQFLERDTRSERESRDNKVAVDAAFAAQKEAAAKQDEANQKAIDKSEKATGETITKLGELFQTSTKSLEDKIDDLKTRVGTTESNINGINQRVGGGNDQSVTQREVMAGQQLVVANQRALVAIVLSVLFLLVSVGSIIALVAVK